MSLLENQPPALPYLFLTEMWERFGFYVVQGMLVLYMSKAFKFPDDVCYTIQGLFTALAFISPIIGGLVADRLLGFKSSILWGGIFLVMGYAMLALPWVNLFYFSLATIIVGNGLFKPNISSLLGTLYEEANPNRESGFTLFYIGINIGVLLAAVSSGYIQHHFGWHAGFGLASIGLLLGLSIFSIGVKRFVSMRYNPLIALPKMGLIGRMGIIGGCIITIKLVSLLLQSSWLANWLFPILGVGLFIFMLVLAYREEPPYRQRLLILSSLMASSIIFWMFFLQLFFSANLFIDRLIQRQLYNIHLSTTYFYALEAIFVMLLGPFFAWAWSSLSLHHHNPASFLKFILAIAFVGLGFLVLGISTYFPNDNNLVNPLWIVLSYFLLTIGELLLSPIGLSAVSVLAPKNLIGMMMGIWFVATGFGGHFAGWLAKLSSVPDNVVNVSEQLVIYRHAFMQYALIAGVVALMLFAIQLFVMRILSSEFKGQN